MTNSGPVRDGATHAASASDETGAQAPLLKLEDFLPHRLNVLSSLVSQALTRVYGRYGIGIPEWRGLGPPRRESGGSGENRAAPPPKHQNKNTRPGGPRPRHQNNHPRARPADL